MSHQKVNGSSVILQVAIIQLCVDARLNHNLLRSQVSEKLAALHLRADSIIFVNEIGGNFGQTFTNTLHLFLQEGAEVIFCGVLHHDGCLAAKHKLRRPLEETRARIQDVLENTGIVCPIHAGSITTETNALEWSS